MTPTLFYDFEQAGLHDQFWLFVTGSLFALIWFGVLPWFLGRSEQGTKVSGYVGAAGGLFLFCVMNYFLV